MFDIGFSELLLVFIIGLVVLGAATTACGGKNGSGLDSRVAFTGDNGAERTDPGVKTPGEFQDSLKKG